MTILPRGVEGGGADRIAVTGGRLDQPAAALGTQPVAVAADGQHMAVVEQPVEDGGGHDRIGKLLGHSSSSTTARYAHIAEHHAKEVNDQVGALVGGVMKAGRNRET